MKAYFSFIASAVFILSMLPGCYTVVSHPDITTKDENGYSYRKQVNFYDDCQSCHSDINNRKYVKKGDENVAAVNTYHGSDDNSYTNADSDEGYINYGDYDDYYEATPYYPTQYYGNYDYYYSRPWWYDVTPPDNSKAVDNYKQSNQYQGQARNNDGGRYDNTSHGNGMSFTSPSSSTSSSSSSSSSSSGSSSSSSSNNSTRSNSSPSSSSDNRSSSGSSNSRNNDGQRSTSSGRR